MRGLLVSGLCLFAVCAGAWSKDPGCDGNPGLTGACYWVDGTIALSADRGFVLFGRNPRRALIIRNAPHSQTDAPENLHRAMDVAQRHVGLAAGEVGGRFLVCPIPPDQAGENICIARAIRLKPPRPDQAAGDP